MVEKTGLWCNVQKVDAGWSSPVARQAHNLKVTGSNPVPATKYKTPREKNLRGVFCVGGTPCATPARKCLASCPGPLKTTSPSTQVGRHGQQRGPEREALPHRATERLSTLQTGISSHSSHKGSARSLRISHPGRSSALPWREQSWDHVSPGHLGWPQILAILRCIDAKQRPGRHIWKIHQTVIVRARWRHREHVRFKCCRSRGRYRPIGSRVHNEAG